MLNTRDLEKRWLKYKIKSFLPYLIITFSVSVIVTSVSYYLSAVDKNNSTSPNTVQTESEVSNLSPTTISDSVKQEIQQPVPTISNVLDTKLLPIETSPEEKKVVLKPSLDFMKKIQESSNGYYRKTPEEETFNTPYVTQTQKVKSTLNKAPKQTIAVENVEVEEKPILNTEENKKILIAKKTSLQDIRDAEKRFKQNNSPALSLFLAKQYYALEDYSKSYNYALVTNQLDKQNEDSWLIFSKSLVKLGKQEEAKKALHEYIKFSHSSNAQLLLDDITTGKFQ